MALELKSPVFANGDVFPIDYTCNGRNVNPPLTIIDVPQGSMSLALIFDDPDAAKEPAGSGKTFDHWIVYNLPPTDQAIFENAGSGEYKMGVNSKGRSSYTGPCPPTFRHKYVFRLFALDCILDFAAPPTKTDVENAAKGHILEEASLVAYYEQPHDK